MRERGRGEACWPHGLCLGMHGEGPWSPCLMLFSSSFPFPRGLRTPGPHLGHVGHPQDPQYSKDSLKQKAGTA